MLKSTLKRGFRSKHVVIARISAVLLYHQPSCLPEQVWYTWAMRIIILLIAFFSCQLAHADIDEFIQACRSDEAFARIMSQKPERELESAECADFMMPRVCVNYLDWRSYWEASSDEDIQKI